MACDRRGQFDLNARCLDGKRRSCGFKYIRHIRIRVDGALITGPEGNSDFSFPRSRGTMICLTPAGRTICCDYDHVRGESFICCMNFNLRSYPPSLYLDPLKKKCLIAGYISELLVFGHHSLIKNITQTVVITI